MIRIGLLTWLCIQNLWLLGQETPTTATKYLENRFIINTISFKSIGPYVMGGRVVDLEVNENDPTEFYVAYATGGIWYTHNNGQSFVSITDSLPVISMGDMTVDWKNKYVWVGTGEANAQRNALAGKGIYKTPDNGKSWEWLGLPKSHHVGKVLLDPRNKNVIWIAVMGSLHSYTKERGVYKTIDGGKSWQQILYINDSTGVIDLVLNPLKPDEIYAAAWCLLKPKPWQPRYSGKSSGIYKTKDGGKRWQLVTSAHSGFLSGDGVGRIGIAVYPKKPNIIYAVVDNRDSIEVSGPNIATHKRVTGAQIYRSTNGGNQWQRMNDSLLDVYSSYGWYFGKIYVSEVNSQKLIVDGILPLVSKNGGQHFELPEPPHVDQHASWMNPRNENHWIVGNDGGVYISYDAGIYWDHLNMPAVGQFYSVAVDNPPRQIKYNVYGGLQDNHVWMGPSSGLTKVDEPSILNGQLKNFYRIIGGPGDGMQLQVDKRNNSIVYVGLERGDYSRKDLVTGKTILINARKYKARQNWETPILISNHNPDVFYYGSERLFRSLTQGDSLLPISGDLTRGGRKYGNDWYGTLTTISESPLQFGLLYTGSDDGLIHRSNDSGISWSLLSIGNIHDGLWVNRLIASRHQKGRIYAALSGYVYDDFSPYLFVSEDYGNTWKAISQDLPLESVYVLREDPVNENLLYIGTEGGLYVSMNMGHSWMAWNKGLPKSVPVRDIAIQERENEIVLGTYGRSLYKAKLTEVQNLAKTHRMQ